MNSKKLVIIDGKSVFYRGYYAMPNLSNSAGVSTGAVYGFAVMALEVLKRLNPDYVIVAWDKSKTNIRARRKIYPGYKANRKPMPEDMRPQIPILRQLLDAFGWPLIEIDDFEADDIMATLARQATTQNIHTTLVTSDLDILQAIDGKADVMLLKRGLTNVVRLDRAAFTAEYSMTPEQFIDYKALKGDSSDNVPGVAGVGDKTARDLIKQFETLEGVYQSLAKIPEKLRTKLETSRDMAFLSHKLLEIRFDVPIELDLPAASVADADSPAITKLFAELEFRRLIDQLPASMRTGQTQLLDGSQESAVSSQENTKAKLTEINSKAELDKIKLAKAVVVYASLDHNSQTQLPELKELIVSPEPSKAYRLTQPELWPKLAERLQDVTVIGFDLKSLFKAFPEFIKSKSLFDVMVAAQIINPLRKTPTLPDLVNLELKSELDKSDPNQVIVSIWEIYARFQDQLKATPTLKEVAETIEWPLLPVLARMELTGIKLDAAYLAEMSVRLGKRINEIEQLVYKQAGQDFNIASPNQLQLILFDKLQLPAKDIKKTKTGYSTGAAELEKLKALHPIIGLIAEYRELTKLKSTYIDPLPQLIDSQSRLHTTFNQIGSQTGRLSSDNPNLMNIPVRTELGREIRRAFVAGSANVLISADYSQFELRLAAVLGKDDNMVHAFNKGIDIHILTAAEMFDIEAAKVTKAQRSAAKTVNFGVLYGMSPHGLSVATGMTRDVAKQFIDQYFELRAGLLDYLNSLKTKAKTDGYVETLFGRRRPMPDINSPNFMIRMAAERAAMNMPIQGTEADLMKLAMIKIQHQLDLMNQESRIKNQAKPGGDAHMLLQIHDSILVECPESQAERTANLLKDVMENIYKLPVKLDVDISIGQNWGEL